MAAVDPTVRPFVAPADAGVDTSLGTLGIIHKVPSALTGGDLAIVEHTLPPRTLAAPLHRHREEDEISIVLRGELGALLGDDVAYAGPGSYVWKPRDQWHTFWNAGDVELHFIELLLPGGFEGFFERLSALYANVGSVAPDLDAVAALSEEYGLELDPSSVPGLCERFGLAFG
jgi:quercetin dioxygenase-like cupin family protein